MANRYGYQFLYSREPMLTMIDGTAAIGSSGAVSAISGDGITSITRVDTGTYKLKLEDDFFRALQLIGSVDAPTTGSAVTAGSFVVGTVYQISTLGNTDWTVAGVDSDVDAAVGVPFVAAAVGSGTGEALAVAPSQVVALQLIGNPQATIKKGVLFFQCVDDAGAVIDPESGATLRISVLLRNSNLKAKGE